MRPTNRSTAHKHIPSYREAAKLAVLPGSIGFPAYYAKETIWDQFLIFFSKQPEVQCHHFSIVFMSVSVELGNNCHCSLNAITATGMSLSSSSFQGGEIF